MNQTNIGELRETIRTSEAELADIEKEIVHLQHEFEAAQKELNQCRHEISVIDVEVGLLKKMNKTLSTIIIFSLSRICFEQNFVIISVLSFFVF